MRTLIFRLGDSAYSLDLAAVLEVVPMPAVTPLPTAGGPIDGLFNLRGQAVPVFDTRQLLNEPTAEPATHLIVVATTRGPAALGATSMPVIAEQGSQVPAEDGIAGAVHRHATGVALVIDPESLLVARLAA